MNTTIDGRNNSKKKYNKIIIAITVLVVIFIIIFLFLRFYHTKVANVDYETSNKNFETYILQVDEYIKEMGYDFKIVSEKNSYDENIEYCFSREKLYLINDNIGLELYFKNSSGGERFCINLISKYNDDEIYKYIDVLVEITNKISGYTFSKITLGDLLEGKRDIYTTVIREDELGEGILIDKRRSMNFFEDWGIRYTVSENNGLYKWFDGIDYYQELELWGVTKTGIK